MSADALDCEGIWPRTRSTGVTSDLAGTGSATRTERDIPELIGRTEPIMGNDKVYVYGEANGASYDEKIVAESDDGKNVSSEVRKRTHWDPRIEVKAFPNMSVQVGIVPASDKSTDEQGLWNKDDGQFLTLDRSGLNRLIEALQEAGAATFGRDRW